MPELPDVEVYLEALGRRIRGARLERLRIAQPFLLRTVEPRPAELEGRVLEAIELIRPALQSDGGDIVFERLDGDGVVHVSLVGACGTCPISMQTLKAGVERIIMDRAPGVTAVVDDTLVDEEPFA